MSLYDTFNSKQPYLPPTTKKEAQKNVLYWRAKEKQLERVARTLGHQRTPLTEQQKRQRASAEGDYNYVLGERIKAEYIEQNFPR